MRSSQKHVCIGRALDPVPWYVRTDLTRIWAYGRVFETTSGEFFTRNDPRVSLIHLENPEIEAVRMIQHLTEQHMYILSLKEAQ